MNNDNIKEIIYHNIKNFCIDNYDALQYANQFRMLMHENTKYVTVKPSKINMYLAGVKIMIVTANQIERDTLFAYFSMHNDRRIFQIAKDNIVYSFFMIRDNKVVHIEPSNIGSNAHGGSSSTIAEAIKVVKPSIIISLGVAFGADFEKNQLGDVLVGRQHFSYDKATKISDKKLKIKKLHIEEPDDYMLSRFKANVSTEDKHHGILGKQFSVILGNMVTGEFVVDSIEMRNLIFSPFQPFDIVGGEMEAYGIFEEIKRYRGIHCILMKGICDWGAGKNEEDMMIRDEKYIPKNDLQTYAMLNTCIVCNKFLFSKKYFDDLRIKGFKKKIWRVFGKDKLRRCQDEIPEDMASEEYLIKLDTLLRKITSE